MLLIADAIMRMSHIIELALLALATAGYAQTTEYNSFDGVGFPTCYNVTVVHNATSVDEGEW